VAHGSNLSVIASVKAFVFGFASVWIVLLPLASTKIFGSLGVIECNVLGVDALAKSCSHRVLRRVRIGLLSHDQLPS